jgi:sec-independent protein translocase protein TatC
VETIKPPETSEIKALINKYTPFLHEIRKRIFFTLGFFLVAMIIGFTFYEKIIKFLIDILSLKGINIVFTSPFQFINLAVTCGFATGIVLVSPLIIYQILSFLKPALKNNEYKLIMRFLPSSIILFITGFLFGILIMKWQIQIFLVRATSLDIGNILDISRLLSVVLMTSILLGIGFEFPIILYLLMRIGVIKHHQLSKQRPWVYLLSFLFVILLPPDSLLADILLTLPLILLFEITLILNRIAERKKRILAVAKTVQEI